MRTTIAERLWGEKASLNSLLLCSAVLLLTMLGARELWTQEWRWADICWNMIHSGDYLHPYFSNAPYYDKPLLSYWLMLLVAKLLGGLSEWALRLPPALAGILTVFCTYKLGEQLVNRRVGLIAGWMLATTFYFVFWGRTANADMLNLAGTMLALVWYFSHRDKPNFFNYAVFFLIIAITSLFKGLIGALIPLIAILPDVLKNNHWRKCLRLSLIPALVPALIIYVLPFWASSHFGGQHYNESGLYQVYRENILRYFQPFDHEDPVYAYFVFLPVYMLPWALFFIPALFAIPKRWQQMNTGSRWFVWSTLLIFIFFTCSGSRRNYYTLPLVPFATLLTADWIAAGAAAMKRYRWAGRTVLISFIILFINFGIVQAIGDRGGMRAFGEAVRQTASEYQPWLNWNIALLDARSKVFFYLQAANPAEFMDLPENGRDYKAQELIQHWPVILEHRPNVILVTRLLYLNRLKPFIKHYRVVIAAPSLGEQLLHDDNEDRPVALIPKSS